LSGPGESAHRSDAYDLARFVSAQAPVIDQVRCELAAGVKRSHWMWFVFPQLRGLGRSATAQRYGLADLHEAGAYLRHPVLGPRLVDCTGLVNAIDCSSATRVFGAPDDLKFHSSMTLFAATGDAPPCFSRALGRFFGNVADAETMRRL
jgi:uncharacterized protein (DUF1810 family)